MLHDIKVRSWCALSATRIIITISFLNTLDSEEYSGQVLAPPFFLNLSGENEHRTLQQDDVTAHIANNSMASSHNTFGDQIMNQSPFTAYY